MAAPIEWTAAPKASSRWDEIDNDNDYNPSQKGGW
jgi:hypothetical protein